MKSFKLNWKYTLGEIFIVIIGITIAFSLNSWNENRKNNQKKQKYLESLKSDIENEKTQLEQNIVSFKEYIAIAENLIPYLGKQREIPDSIPKMVFKLANPVNFIPQKVTYNTMINSGDFNLIQNFELKTTIQKHFSDQDLILYDYDRLIKIHEKYFSDFLIYQMDYNKMRKGQYEFMESKMLENVVYSLYGTFKMAIQASEKGIESCNTVINAIDQELN